VKKAGDEATRQAKENAARKAAEMVETGMVVGLGTGSTTALAIAALGQRVAQERLEIIGVPTSFSATLLGRQAGLEVRPVDAVDHVDLAFDGADEVDPQFHLIKGGGAAHTQEKVVDAWAQRFVVLVDDSKLVDCLGVSFPVPIEVLPFAISAVQLGLRELGAEPSLRYGSGKDGPVITDHGNLVVVDDEDRENEGDLCMAAEKVTPEAINFMITHGRGLVCLPMQASRISQLNLHPQAPENTSRMGTNFTVSIEARDGVTTGISAADRAKTILTAIDEDCRPEDLQRPGHIFPLRAEPGGVLVRTGHTEGLVDLCTLASMKPCGVLCEILNEDGSMARIPDLERFSQRHKLKVTSIAEIIEYRRHHERLIEHSLSLKLPTEHGEFDVHLYRSRVDSDPHLALTRGIPDPSLKGPALKDPVLVRVHSSCFTGDLLDSLRCDCGSQLRHALEQIGQAERGVLLYMQQEGRGIGLENKLKAYVLQQTQGLDTVEANRALGFPPDVRHYGIGAQILRDLGVRKIRLLTNNPRKYHAIKGYNLEIVERVAIEIEANPENRRYLETKRDKLGHDLRSLGSDEDPKG
jgi:3,4-dihydroxy 2-butanone 4-phosphate synthase/GTP cyclohydrolase II